MKTWLWSQKSGGLVGLLIGILTGWGVRPLPPPPVVVEVPEPPPPEERPDPEPAPVQPPAPAPVGVQLLRAPFEGEHGAPNWFNHDLTLEQGQLVYTGVVQKGKRKHVGYDWSMPIGTPILAAAAGTVTIAAEGIDHCPNMEPEDRPSKMVRVLHDGGQYSTLYMHLDRIDVQKGQKVAAGQQLALSGNSGCSTGPHLHFGVTKVTNPSTGAGDAVDPYGWEGTFPDPTPHPSVRLWIDGTAPVLRRTDEQVER